MNLSAAIYYKSKVDSIVIVHSDWELHTDTSISSADFPQIAKRRYSITDDRLIWRIQRQLGELTKMTDSKPDVRCKIYMYAGDSIVTTLCCNSWRILVAGEMYRFPDELYALVNNIIDGEKWMMPSRDEFPCYSNFLVTDKEKLNSMFSSLFCTPKTIKKGKSYVVVVECRVDIHGHVLEARCRNLPSFVNEEKFMDAIYEEVEWNYNPERGNAEKLVFSITLSSGSFP